MGSRNVQSAAGETIEIVPDDEWLASTGGGWPGLRQWHGLKPLMVERLWLDGPYTNKSGQASLKLYQSIQRHYPNEELPKVLGISHLMQHELNAPAFEREIGGKRTYSIRLVAMPDMWYRKLMAMQPQQPQRKAIDQVEAPLVAPATNGSEPDTSDIQELLDSVPGPDAPTTYDMAPPLELSIASQVAMSLLTTVVDIISAGSNPETAGKLHQLQKDLDDVSQRLAQRLGENDSLRKQLRLAGDEIGALRVERDGLRSRLRATEINLQNMMKGETAQAINGEIQRRVDQIMRTTPGTKKGDD